MTIDEAKEVIEQDIPCEHDPDLIEALHMALASLEAWEKVKREIREFFKEGVMDGDVITTHLCEIIDRHLREIEE